ncbi:hypothetical protein F6X68_24715 [Micromonospora sp. AMSO12t]|uniref:hypothetical protein n=1 Tax=Micromonospora sp. AMSO12t TaxID=2650410 RepID=UPI00124B148B|nr:hypothetical protein [Micromonospora sp. AMSO12t]KAB1138983.1 hypothetical protein F6X68_24715 [Micromonospora sp. AMSO12t]
MGHPTDRPSAPEVTAQAVPAAVVQVGPAAVVQVGPAAVVSELSRAAGPADGSVSAGRSPPG